MSKTAFAVISLVVLFSTVVVSQLCSFANGNPNWKPWEHPVSHPTLDVDSPVAGEIYSSDDVWLNFTLTKPSDWFTKPDCYISYVTYCIDGSATGPNGRISDNSDENETIIPVQDKGVVNPPTSLSFSFNLEGLTAGTHTLEILAEGNYDWTGFGITYPRTYFRVYASSPTPTPSPTATPEPTPFEETGVQSTSQFMVAGGAVALVSIIVFLGLLVYLMKRK
jgi:hypothetical protein